MTITHELTDQQMAVIFIQGMDRRVSIRTIIRRLQTIEATIEMAGKMIADGMLDEQTACQWIYAHLKIYEHQ